jgi:glutathione reductase (NADPH)
MTSVPDRGLPSDVDLLVIGGGSGGVRAARVAASHGANVVLVEEHRLGGTCVIRGCVPKKLMVLASRFAHDLQDARGFGWRADAPRFSWPGLKQAIDGEVARLESVYASLLERAGVHVVHDRAVFEDARTVRLTARGELVRARHVLVATGSTPVAMDIPGARWIQSSNDVFDWPALPHRVLVYGAGYIALEFASLLGLLGSDVTLVFRGDRILRGFDDEARTHLQAALASSGVRVLPATTLLSVTGKGEGRTLEVHLSDGRVQHVDAVLGATGRRPNTQGLGLERAGVHLGPRGEVLVDEFARTNIEGVHAVGDVAQEVALTPVAIRDGQSFADRLFGGRTDPVRHASVPTAVFTTPELATVGLSEEAAVRAHPGDVDVYAARFRPMRATLSGREGQVLMKLIVRRSSDRVLGAHIVGPEAAEMVQLLAVALQAAARKSDLDSTLAVHPTLAEELCTLRRPTRRHTEPETAEVESAE